MDKWDLPITDDRSPFQNKAFVDAMWERANKSEKDMDRERQQLFLRMVRGTEQFKTMPPLSREQAWSLIFGKAHLYETAFSRTKGEYVKILGVVSPGVFRVREMDGFERDYGCEQLVDYCL